MSRFSSILIANRGEIACRVMRTARALGYRTVAVYTDVDASAPHVRMADRAERIGAGPASNSYLAIDAIVAAARASGAGAVHPGYGFLSENASFARACADAGLVFIGPSPEAIELMGNKADAKRRMLEAGVPCVPGYQGEKQDDAVLVAEAEKLGLPVMVKAALGGGGRGMRLVHRADELSDAIRLARSEADNAFGSDELLIEKAILRPRHVEVQIFADAHGNTLHLGERDCSVQRRHQKVIEEAPCPVMTDELRTAMTAAAVAAARSIDYRGAGTVEFLLDADGAFYFLEMNTRLQVEHPVTEMITGLDLVALQIRVAQGDSLGVEQDDVRLEGHAIEARLCAEDPARDFLPTSGRVVLWEPALGDGIRIDSGIVSGQLVSPYYDSMVAKVIAVGPDREAARLRLVAALGDTVLFGVGNNRRFLAACLEKGAFVAGEATTAFIGEEFDPADLDDASLCFEDAAVAAVLDLAREHEHAVSRSVLVAPELKDWSSAAPLVSHRQYRIGARLFDLEVAPLPAHFRRQRYRVTDGESATIVEIIRLDDHAAGIGIDGRRTVARFSAGARGELYLLIEGRSTLFHNAIDDAGKPDEAGVSGRIRSPMHGSVMHVLVGAGEEVVEGQTLLVMEAMKMQHEVAAPAAGRVVEVFVSAGEQVAADDELLEIERPEEKAGC